MASRSMILDLCFLFLFCSDPCLGELRLILDDTQDVKVHGDRRSSRVVSEPRGISWVGEIVEEPEVNDLHKLTSAALSEMRHRKTQTAESGSQVSTPDDRNEATVIDVKEEVILNPPSLALAKTDADNNDLWFPTIEETETTENHEGQESDNWPLSKIDHQQSPQQHVPKFFSRNQDDLDTLAFQLPRQNRDGKRAPTFRLGKRTDGDEFDKWDIMFPTSGKMGDADDLHRRSVSFRLGKRDYEEKGDPTFNIRERYDGEYYDPLFRLSGKRGEALDKRSVSFRLGKRDYEGKKDTAFNVRKRYDGEYYNPPPRLSGKRGVALDKRSVSFRLGKRDYEEKEDPAIRLGNHYDREDFDGWGTLPRLSGKRGEALDKRSVSFRLGKRDYEEKGDPTFRLGNRNDGDDFNKRDIPMRLGKRSKVLDKRSVSFRLGKRDYEGKGDPTSRLGELDDGDKFDKLAPTLWLRNMEDADEFDKRGVSFRLGKRDDEEKRAPTFRLGKRQFT